TVEWNVELGELEYRHTPEEAARDVQHKACDQVANLVKQYHPDANWRPTNQFLKSKLRCSDPVTSVPPNIKIVDNDKPDFYTARVHLELTPAAREELFRIVRLEEARERQWMLSKSLFGILAGLIAVAGYLRINERTSGAYSFLLQIGAV